MRLVPLPEYGLARQAGPWIEKLRQGGAGFPAYGRRFCAGPSVKARAASRRISRVRALALRGPCRRAAAAYRGAAWVHRAPGQCKKPRRIPAHKPRACACPARAVPEGCGCILGCGLGTQSAGPSAKNRAASRRISRVRALALRGPCRRAAAAYWSETWVYRALGGPDMPRRVPRQSAYRLSVCQQDGLMPRRRPVLCSRTGKARRAE